jgi:uncharacterized protein YbaA (DUF1428 family)
MSYVDGFVCAVADADREAYRRHAEQAAQVCRDHGALRVVECWGDDVPDGVVTSFPLAVKLKAGESVVFSWILWPSRAVRDAAWPRVIADERMPRGDDAMPFDGQRMIFGGFDILVDV